MKKTIIAMAISLCTLFVFTGVSFAGPQENAVRSAKQYLSTQGFSCNGLIQQLSSSFGSKYTVSQATYGARQTGACR